MKKLIFFLWFALLFASLAPAPASAQEETPTVLVLTADGPVTSAMVEYLRRGIRTATQMGAEAIVFRLDTPGGSIDLMDSMIQDIRASQVPVIVYVWPRGAIAGSAGTLITMAGHLAAMAPESAIGAASPVGGQGEDLETTLESKIVEATKAQVRSLMEGRRPPEAIALAEETIENALAVTAGEAFEVGMIDFIARDVGDLLEQAQGSSVRVGSGPRRLNTANASIQELPSTFIEQLLSLLTNPNVVFILLSIGVQAILIELGSPGGWVAGFMGAVCIALALFGLGILGANWLGLVFIAIAFVLFVLEVKAATHGALTTAGVVSFIVGALVLFNSPGTPEFQRVSVPLVVVTGLFIGGIFFVVVLFAIRAQSSPIQTGHESIVGRIGIARTDLAPAGIIQLGGEQWSARVQEDGQEAVTAGDRVEVVRAEGVRVVVRKV